MQVGPLTIYDRTSSLSRSCFQTISGCYTWFIAPCNINLLETAGLGGIPGWVLRDCSEPGWSRHRPRKHSVLFPASEHQWLELHQMQIKQNAQQMMFICVRLYSLCTHDCKASHNKKNIIFKFADDTTVLGLITGGDGKCRDWQTGESCS